MNPVRWESWGRRFVREGTAHLENRHAFFSLRVPLPEHKLAPARLHVAVPFITHQDLERNRGVAARQDFDRLMDLVQIVAREMVGAGVLISQRHPLEIVPEILDATGTPRKTHQKFVSMCIAVSWLRDDTSAIFPSYRHWDYQRGRWGRRETSRSATSE